MADGSNASLGVVPSSGWVGTFAIAKSVSGSSVVDCRTRCGDLSIRLVGLETGWGDCRPNVMCTLLEMLVERSVSQTATNETTGMRL